MKTNRIKPSPVQIMLEDVRCASAETLQCLAILSLYGILIYGISFALFSLFSLLS